jgi:CheY-like chemotaxis protein
MSNAAKHTQAGGLLRIRADLRIGSPVGGVQGTSRLARRHCFPTPSDKVEMIMISVSNSGPGVPIDMFDKLFRPFQSGDVEIGGTGLGLFGIALRSESIGGKCGYNGNEFWFTFPYIAVDLASAPESDSPASEKCDPALMVTDSVSLNSLLFPDTVSSMNLKFNILIVEDSTPISAMMSETLSRRGHSTKVASNGEDALQLLKENWKSENANEKYDVLMLDFKYAFSFELERWTHLILIKVHFILTVCPTKVA